MNFASFGIVEWKVPHLPALPCWKPAVGVESHSSNGGNPDTPVRFLVVVLHDKRPSYGFGCGFSRRTERRARVAV